MYHQNNIGTISDMRLKPKDLLEKATDCPVYMFYRSRPKAVLVSIKDYDRLLMAYDDYLLALRTGKYANEDKTKIKWSKLSEIKKEREKGEI